MYDASYDGRDVIVEVSVNAFDYTNGGLVYRYYDETVWMMHKFHPKGGPQTGNTSIVVSGFRFQDLGDVRCRLGDLNEEVNASLSDEATLHCVSPRHWSQESTTQTVDLEITLNGQQYLLPKPHQSAYSFYEVGSFPTGLTVRRLDPPGGPERGGTLVRLSGSGFDDFGGLRCQFEGEAAVEASLVDSEYVQCYSPPRSPNASHYVDGMYDERALELTINGDLRAASTSAIPFAYYVQDKLAVSHIYPRGGPREGGTRVTVWGAGFRDLGHGNHEDVPSFSGLFCRFGSLDLVPANLTSSGGDGPQQLLCYAPAIKDSDRCEALVVRVTNNADNPPGGAALTADDVAYTYYESFEGRDDGRSTPPYGGAYLS